MQLSLQRPYADFLGITHFVVVGIKILLSMFHIDLNANELHIIQSWENWKNAVLLDLARDSCVPPSLNPQSCHKDKTSADSLPAVLLLIHIEDKPGACGD